MYNRLNLPRLSKGQAIFCCLNIVIVRRRRTIVTLRQWRKSFAGSLGRASNGGAPFVRSRRVWERLVKPCSKCGQIKALEEFSPNTGHRDGHASQCKSCHAEIGRKWNAAHKKPREIRSVLRSCCYCHKDFLVWPYLLARGGSKHGAIKHCSLACRLMHEKSDREHDLERARALESARPPRTPECEYSRSRAWNAANPGKHREHQRAWMAAHPEKKQESAEYCRAYRIANAVRHRAYRIANRDKIRAREAEYRARKVGATVGEANYAIIVERDKWTCHICGKRVRRDTLSFDHLIPLSLGGPHTKENIRVAHRRCNYSRGAGRLPAQLLLIG